MSPLSKRSRRSQQHDAQVTYDDIVTAMVRFYCYIYQSRPTYAVRPSQGCRRWPFPTLESLLDATWTTGG